MGTTDLTHHIQSIRLVDTHEAHEARSRMG